jgi:pyruvyltransferase
MYKRFIREIKKKNQLIQYFIGWRKGDLVKAYWYDYDVNFGDLLTPVLLERIGLRPVYSEKQDADVVSVGSILNNLPEDYHGYIVGSGLISDTVRRFPNAKILAVRGELTRERIGAPRSTKLGDPGLLADKLIKSGNKQYTLGIIPHFIDKSDLRIQEIFQHNRNDVLIIDVQRKPKEVIQDIDKCEYILSSSLRGIIVADSLKIPNGWIVLSEKVIGNGFKFYDHSSALRIKCKPNYLTGNESLAKLIGMTHNVSENTDNLKDDLEYVFQKLGQEILEKNQLWRKKRM